MFQKIDWFLGCSTLFGGESSTPEILRLVVVRDHAKFSSSTYNGWSIEIAGMKVVRSLRASPFGGGWVLSHVNLPLAQMC